MVTGGLHNPHDPQHWRGINALAERLVVEADVTASDGRIEELAGFGDAFDGFDKLCHDFRPLGVAEVETVGGRHRLGAHRGQVAAALGHRELGAFARIQITVALVAVERHRNGRAGFLDAHDGRVGTLRAGDGVGADLVIVLLPDPALGAQVGGGQQRGKGFLNVAGG